MPARRVQRRPVRSQVALGLYYLHSCKPPVLHLDLKSANVLLDEAGTAKVCDFGLAKLKQEGSAVLTQRMGSPMWTAPEVLKGEARDEKADSYSYGMLVFELMSCRLPYADHAAAQVMMGVITNLLPRPKLPAERADLYPAEITKLMQRCWEFEASLRPGFNEILDELERVAREQGLATALGLR